jgi:hypothetical protein
LEIGLVRKDTDEKELSNRMLMPAFCPQDPGGPVSQTEALRLLKVMHQHFCDVTYEHQVIREETHE